MRLLKTRISFWRYLGVRAAALTVLVFAICPVSQAQRAFETDILRDTFGYDRYSEKSVKLSDLKQGCRMRDCIRSIDKPKYVDAAYASFVADDEPVLALEWNGEYRAWPTRIMDQHEIVNDVIGGEPIAITWCPLCGSAVGVKRTVNGEVTEFGVSGLLYNSDLVFYDRTTNTLWDQIEAKGIVGPLTGHALELVPITLTTWRTWRMAHPQTQVLSTDTGYFRAYSQDPYASYRESDQLMFPVKSRSSRIRPKSVVYGFDIDGDKIAFTEAVLQAAATVDADLDGRTVTARLREDGSVRVIDGDSEHAPVRLFWFAWYTFHPDTELVE